MKFFRFATLLLSLGALGWSCSHYDPKRPGFSKKSAPSPDFDATKTPGAGKDPAKTGSGDSADTQADPSLPRPGRNGPDPMSGPGMSSSPVPIPTQAPKPGDMPPPPAPVNAETYEEALAQIDKAKERDGNLKSFWVGGGYDILSGNRLPTCLDPTHLRTQVTSRMETTDSYSVAHDYRDLYSKLETEFGTDIGGMWQIFTGSLSFKTKIMKETKMTTDDVVVVAGFTYLRDQVALQNPGISYASFFQSLSQKNRELFRKYCGDKFTKDVSVGASMHLVFTAKKTDSSKWDKTKVEAAIRVGLAGILGIGASSSTSSEQKAILKSYSFSTKCYTLGTSADICGGYSSTTAFDINADVDAIQKKIQAVKDKMFAEVKEGKNLAVVKETLLDYEVPLIACNQGGGSACPSRWEYFSDYRDRLSKLRKMSLSKSEADDVCAKTPYWARRCQQVNDQLSTAINNCLNLAEECHEPKDDEFRIIVSAKNPGSVELWDNAKYTGGFWGLDFRNLLNGGSLEANRFYGLGEIGMSRANDKVSSLRSHLHPAWRIRFYRDGVASSPGQPYEVSGTRDVENVGLEWRGANDSISAFQLLPMDDL